jgi:hypothetical protein
MAWQTQDIPWAVDGTEIASLASVTTDAIVGSAVQTGKGIFAVVATISNYIGGSGFDLISFRIQANTAAATSTWYDIGHLVIGDTTAIGSALTSVTNAVIIVKNDYDHQIRVFSYVQGSAVSCTADFDLYPLVDVRA